jgi:hypothetical protein
MTCFSIVTDGSVAIPSLGNGASSKPFASDKLIHIKDRTWRSNRAIGRQRARETSAAGHSRLN